jgi:flavin-dependent dehydrogenase
MSQIPSKTQILVIGGGPSGSYGSTCLAREGFQVTLLEADAFPRYHVGESLVPSMRTFLEFTDAFNKVNDFGFLPKPGGAFKLNQHKREGYTDFSRFDSRTLSWQVTRADFDDILLKHAKSCGVNVFESTRVTDIKFEDDDVNKRPIAAEWKTSTSTGTIAFDYVIDASGRAGILATKHLKIRKINPSLKNTAMWGYWRNTGRYGEGTERRNAIWTETLKDESGWVWFIPLHDGTTSIGFVQAESAVIERKKAFKAIPGNENSTLQDFYMSQFEHCPHTKQIMKDTAQFVEVGKDGGAAVKQAADYSYSSTQYAGPGWRLSGDAGCFIDPFFSSGVHLALTGGLSAAATIASAIRGVPEEDAIKWHNSKIGIAYNRFLLLVLTSYKQMRNQKLDVLSGVDEDNFDRAFDLIRPIIQGTHDVNRKITETEVEEVMEFLNPIAAAPINPLFEEDHFTGQAKLTQQKLEELMEDEAIKKHAKENEKGWNVIQPTLNAAHDFGSENLHGYTILMQRGKLSMVPTSAGA